MNVGLVLVYSPAAPDSSEYFVGIWDHLSDWAECKAFRVATRKQWRSFSMRLGSLDTILPFPHATSPYKTFPTTSHNLTRPLVTHLCRILYPSAARWNFVGTASPTRNRETTFG